MGNHVNRQNFSQQQNPTTSGKSNYCKKCNSTNIQMQAVAETKKRGCLAVLLYIVLLCIPIIGWIALFMLLRGKKSKTVTYSVCQNCGKRKKA